MLTRWARPKMGFSSSILLPSAWSGRWAVAELLLSALRAGDANLEVGLSSILVFTDELAWLREGRNARIKL